MPSTRAVVVKVIELDNSVNAAVRILISDDRNMVRHTLRSKVYNVKEIAASVDGKTFTLKLDG